MKYTEGRVENQTLRSAVWFFRRNKNCLYWFLTIVDCACPALPMRAQIPSVLKKHYKTAGIAPFLYFINSLLFVHEINLPGLTPQGTRYNASTVSYKQPSVFVVCGVQHTQTCYISLAYVTEYFYGINYFTSSPLSQALCFPFGTT